MARSTTTSKTKTTAKTATTRSTRATAKAAPKTSPAKATAQTAAKTAAAKAATTASASKTPEIHAPELTVVENLTPVVSPGVMKKREFMKAVMARSGARQKLAKPVVEAALEILGEALAEGRELNLPPMGKVKIQRQKKAGNATISVLKMRRSAAQAASGADASGTAGEKPDEDAKEGIADSEE